MRVLCLLVGLMMIAGCADQPVEEPTDSDDVQVQVTKDTGAIRGVVVDATISPIPEVEIKAEGGGESLTTTTDVDGIFIFNKLNPGPYILTASHPLYTEATSSVIVEAGVENPPAVRMQIERLFEEDPSWETLQYRGHVGCAYNYGISSTCVNDYTRICGNVDPSCCPGGCAPQVTGIVDQREYQSAVGPGWQSIVWEMAWTSSLSGTAEEMQITVSYAERQGASHWYTSGSMEQPYRLQCDLGIDCQEMSTNSDNPEGHINPEGQDDLWNMIAAGDSNVAISQDIEVFQTNFYYAPSPEGWSLVEGDGDPY